MTKSSIVERVQVYPEGITGPCVTEVVRHGSFVDVEVRKYGNVAGLEILNADIEELNKFKSNRYRNNCECTDEEE